MHKGRIVEGEIIGSVACWSVTCSASLEGRSMECMYGGEVYIFEVQSAFKSLQKPSLVVRDLNAERKRRVTGVCGSRYIKASNCAICQLKRHKTSD